MSRAGSKEMRTWRIGPLRTRGATWSSCRPESSAPAARNPAPASAWRRTDVPC